MKRVWGSVFAGGALAALGASAIFACTHDDSTLFVQDVLAAQPVTQGQVCFFTADPTQDHISSGILDIALRDEYDPTYLVGNQGVQLSNSAQLMTETNTINLQGAIVRITDAGGTQLKTFTRLAGGTVYPGTGNVPGYTPIQVTTVDTGTANSLLGDSTIQAGGSVRLVTYVKFFGKNLGGTYVESNEFEFPVDVCYGCLIAFSPADQATHTEAGAPLPTPNCQAALTAGTNSSLPVPCYPGQDFAIDCAQCVASNPACNGALAGRTFAGFDAGGD